MPKVQTPARSAQDALHPLQWLLHRLVQVALKVGVTYPAMAALLKRSYLRAAQELEGGDGAESVNSSRLSLLTGMTRDTLRRLQADSVELRPAPRSLAARVASRWSSLPYVDAKGRRVPLARLQRPDGLPSFEALVREETTDIGAASLLADWLTQGLVRVDESDRVHFNVRTFQAQAARIEQDMGPMALMAGDLMRGLLLDDQGRFSHRYCWLENLTPESAEQLRAAFADVTDAVDAVFRLGLDLEVADLGKPAAKERVQMCVFRYQAEMTKDPQYPGIRTAASRAARNTSDET